MSLNAAVHRRPSRGTWAAILFSTLLVAAATPQTPPTSRPGAETGATFLSQFVPAETGFYVEAANAGDLLLGLAEPELWSALAEIAGQPAGAEDTAEWAQRVEQSLGMGPREAIRLLLANRVAFAGESTSNGQDAIILCTPTVSIDQYLETWGAQPLPHEGLASVYRLRSGVGLATAGGIACFGDPRPRSGIFAKVVQCMDGATGLRLAQQPAFRELLNRVPPSPTALLFARLDLSAVASQPFEDGFGRAPQSAPTSSHASSQPSVASLLPIPESLRDSKHVLLAMHRDKARLDFTITGDAARALSAETTRAFRPVAVAPADCLVSWQGEIDYPGVLELSRTLPDRNVLRIALKILERTAGLYEFAEALGSSTAVFVGASRPDRLPSGAPPTPVIGLAIALDDEATAERRLQTLNDAASVYNLLALNNGWPLLEGVQALVLDGVAVSALDLRPLWRKQTAELWVEDIQLCWTIYDGALLLATSSSWMTKLIAARRSAGSSGSSEVTGTSHPAVAPPPEGLYLATGGVGRLARDWLDFFASRAPDFLNEAWWLERQPGLKNPQLGLTATQNAEKRWLEVTQVQPGSPARGVLRPGDCIVGTGAGRRFATSQPAEEFRNSIQSRERAGWLEVTVQRENELFLRRIRLPFIDPAQFLRRLAAIGHLVEKVAYVDQRDQAGHPTGRLTLQLATTSDKPLAKRGSAPASAPADPTAN